MARMRSVLPQVVESMGGSMADAAKIARAAEVRRMWSEILLSSGDSYLLEHTNNVFIMRGEEARKMRSDHDDLKDAGGTGEGKQLIVYVDESIVAAELNARRELMKFLFFERYGEEIDTFKIIISHGRYKQHHPFAQPDMRPDDARVQSVALDEGELSLVEQQVARIENPRLKDALRRAMVADLEWKKGISQVVG